MRSEIISVDHTHKGDRLPLVSKRASKVSPVVTTLSHHFNGRVVVVVVANAVNGRWCFFRSPFE
jgi:hypothetical protein